jgi:alpha-beta hydrolase superfamily lysophospholipase
MLEGLFHEVLLEPERGRVLAIMLEWIRERVAARE